MTAFPLCRFAREIRSSGRWAWSCSTVSKNEKLKKSLDSPSFVPWEGGVHDKQILFQDTGRKEWTES